MAAPLNVNDLEIVGYANNLKETMLPTVVPPVFVLRADRQRAFVPPYSLHAGLLCDSTELPRSELDELAASGKITLFDREFPAERGFELWIDQQFQPRYEPLYEARHRLDRIAQDAIAKAEEALRGGDVTGAERFSSIAISADDRKVEPLAIKAAIRRSNRNAAGERVMAELALPILGEKSFVQLADRYFELIGQAPAQPLPPRRDHSPMYRVACRRVS
jgi:hypothetical protein